MTNLDPTMRIHVGHERVAEMLRTAQRDRMIRELERDRPPRSRRRRRGPSIRQILRRLRPAVHQEAR